MQLELFGGDKMLREEIRGALVRMDISRAEQLVESYRKLQDAEPLDWELDLLTTEKQWPDPLGAGRSGRRSGLLEDLHRQPPVRENPSF
jgi:hypothetical protein